MDNQEAIKRLTVKIQTRRFKRKCYRFMWICVISALASMLIINSSSAKEIKVMQEDTLNQIMEIRQDMDRLMYEPSTTYYRIPLSEEKQDFVFETCKQYSNVNPLIVFAVMEQESDYRENVISNGNYGIMQINLNSNKDLVSQFGITDIMDFEQNVHAGIYKLSCALENTDSLDKALMVYNQGGNGAKRDWNKGIYQSEYSQSVIRKIAEIKEK